MPSRAPRAADDQIARQRDLEAAGDGEALDRGDQRLLRGALGDAGEATVGASASSPAREGILSGMDLKAFVAGESPYAADRGFAGITQRAAEKPLIAAIEGFAVAGGFEVRAVVRSDRRRPRRTARHPRVKRSLVAAGGALLRLPQRIPYQSPWSWRSPATDRGRSAATSWASSTAWPSPGAPSMPRSSWPPRSRATDRSP